MCILTSLHPEFVNGRLIVRRDAAATATNFLRKSSHVGAFAPEHEIGLGLWLLIKRLKAPPAPTL